MSVDGGPNDKVNEKVNDKATKEAVISVQHWTDKLLTFRTTRSPDYHFVPGQFARLGLMVNGEMVWRAYSITSASGDDFLEYYAIIVPGGAFTTALAQITEGDPVWVEKLSYGFMTADRFADGSDLWMLATGTGLGPFVSLLQERPTWERFRHLVLVHCVRHADELTYQDKFAALQEQAATLGLPATLHLVRVTTRESQMRYPDQMHGRITTLLQDGSLERQVGLAIDIDASRLMVCGNPDMITETRELLRQRGLGPCRRNAGGQFITEDYW